MIQQFADWLVYGIFGLDAATPLGTAVNFFFYDSIKIIILLFSISFVMGIINAYFPIERLRQYLATHKLYGLDYFLAALFGGSRRPSGLRKTILMANSLAHRTTWLRSDLHYQCLLPY